MKKTLIICGFIAACVLGNTLKIKNSSDESNTEQVQGMETSLGKDEKQLKLVQRVFTKKQGIDDVCYSNAGCANTFETCQNNKCEHKPVWPLKPIEWIGLVIMVLLLALANIGGIGGGGIIIPVCISMYGFGTRHAIALSNAIIFLGAVTRYVGFSSNDCNPFDKSKTLINHSLSCIMMPMVLIGSYVGVMLNVLMPEVVLCITLTLVLIFLTYETASIGFTTYGKETITINQKIQAQIDLQKEEEENTFLPRPSNEEKSVSKSYSTEAKGGPEAEIPDENKGLALYQEKDSAQVIMEKAEYAVLKDRETSELKQWRIHLLNIVLVGITFMVKASKGSAVEPSIIGIDTCGAPAWSLLGVFVISFLLWTKYQCSAMRADQVLIKKYDDEYGIEQDPQIIQYTGSSLFMILFGSFCGGVVGALGLGGSVVFNPVMLGLGVRPRVASATSMYITLFGACSRTLVFLLMGDVDLPYAGVLGLCGICGIIGGLTLIKKLLAKYERPSIIVFVLAVILGISAIMVPVFNVKNMLEHVKEHISITSFGSLCPHTAKI